MCNLALPRNFQEQGPELIGTILSNVMADIHKKSFGTPQRSCNTLTGFSDLDLITGGFHPGSINIIAARPSMGKRQFALKIAMHVAQFEPFPVVLFSLYMHRMNVAKLVVGQMAEIDNWTVQNAAMTDDELARLQTSIVKIQDARLYVDDSPELSVQEIHDRLQGIHHLYGGLGLVLIDSLQMMYTDKGNAEASYRGIMRSLRSLAKKCNAPVIVLSRLGRKLERRKNKRPLLKDFTVPSVWKHADLVLFVYRDEIYDPESEYRGKTEIIIGKNRNGSIGSFQLDFDRKKAVFPNMHSKKTDPLQDS
jgi:replicative DNA helicase